MATASVPTLNTSASTSRLSFSKRTPRKNAKEGEATGGDAEAEAARGV